VTSDETDLEEIIKKLEKGELSISKLDSFLGNSNLAALVRRLYLERKLGVNLSSIASTILDFNDIVGRNIENPIGAVQIPLAVAGPLLINDEYAKGEYYIPLATTEGALVASINRGCKAITVGGGARARVISDGMARAPLIRTESVEKALELVKWVESNENVLREAASRTTKHGALEKIQPFIVGNLVWLRLVYRTGDAMGMNMATIASDEVCKVIEKSFPEAECVALSGNMCVDKKPSCLNKLLGRGKYVVAEALLPRDVVVKILKTEPEAIHYINISKNLMGSAAACSLSFNAHFANIIAAIFIATGQDVAQVVESSLGYTWTELREDGSLYISVTLPSLEVGTVGGGTWLPTQREALELLGVAGGGSPPGINALKFAEIVASAVLAGELNLLAALAAGHLARAHEKLGRAGKKR